MTARAATPPPADIDANRGKPEYNHQPPLSLYVHFPWCVQKCPYCDFNSHTRGKTLDQQGYVGALLRDFRFELGLLSRKPVPLHSIFLGGGTPSLFSPESIGNLLTGIRSEPGFESDIEVTMEANPGTTEHARFEDYRRAGVTRLSLGVQSFDNAKLKVLGRIHDSSEAQRAFNQARSGGFDNINIDLMYGLPDQTLEQAIADVEQAISLGPEHISLYQLTIEPNTVFFRYPPGLPQPETIFNQQVALQERLAAAGYEQYEVSAYAKQQRQSAHNLNYWEFGDYIGIGAGAHGKYTERHGIARRSRKKHPATYWQHSGTAEALAEDIIVPLNDVLGEYMMNSLRLRAGFDLFVAQSRTGLSREAIRRSLQPSIDKGLLKVSGDQVHCTDQGYLFLDSLLVELI